MFEAHKKRSEVANVLLRIGEEYEAARRGISGVAQGVSRHCFINARMERIGELHAELHTMVGDDSILLMDACMQRDAVFVGVVENSSAHSIEP